MSDYSWIGPLISGVAKGAVDVGTGISANNQIQGGYDEMLRRLAEREAEINALGGAGYQNIMPQEVGPSALEGLTVDPAAAQAQQEALAILTELIQGGGLTLGDKKALNDVEATLNRNTLARRKGLANEFAARGQLGAGAQLGMALDANQNAAMNANQRAESVAAQAQQRAMDAMLEKGRMARGMANDDYARKAEAARARDAIEARNAAARTHAATANNAIAGQRFDDNFAKVRAKMGLSGQQNQAAFGKGVQNARTTGAMGAYAGNAIDQGATAWDRWSNEPSASQKAGDAAWDDEEDEP